MDNECVCNCKLSQHADDDGECYGCGGCKEFRQIVSVGHATTADRNCVMKSDDGIRWENARKVDKVVEAVREDLLRRSQHGIAKYGVTLERNDLSILDWHQHHYEELLDAANYTKRIIMTMRGELP